MKKAKGYRIDINSAIVKAKNTKKEDILFFGGGMAKENVRPEK